MHTFRSDKAKNRFRNKVLLAVCFALLTLAAVVIWAKLPCPVAYYLASWDATCYQDAWPISRSDYSEAKRFAAARKGAWGAVVSSVKIQSATQITFRITQSRDERGNGGGLEYTLEKTPNGWFLANSGFWHDLNGTGTGGQ